MQSDKTNNIDKLLKGSLGDLTLKTGQEDWVAIMDDLNRIEGKEKGGNRKRILYFIFSICLISLLVSGGYLLLNKKGNLSGTPADNKSDFNLKSIQPNNKSIYSESKNVDGLNTDLRDNNIEKADISKISVFNKEEISKINDNNSVQNIKNSNAEKTEGIDNKSHSGTNFRSSDEISDASQVKDIDDDNMIRDLVVKDVTLSMDIPINVSAAPVDSLTSNQDNDLQKGSENNDDASKKDVIIFDSSYSDSSNKNTINANDPGLTIPKTSIDIINLKGAMLSFVISPVYNSNHNTIRPEASEQVHRDYENISKESERISYGYTFGIGLNYKFTTHLSVGAGVNYTSIIESNEYNYEIGDIPVIDSKTNNIIAYIPRTAPISVASSTTNKFDYVEFPINLGYMSKIGDNFGIVFNMGINSQKSINPQGLVISTQSLKLVDLKSENNIPIRPWNFEGDISIGILKSIRKNIILAVEYEFRKQFLSVYEDKYPIQTKNNSSALSATVLWKFKLKNK